MGPSGCHGSGNGHDRVAFRDELEELLVPFGEGGGEASEGLVDLRCEFWCAQFVENVEVSAFHGPGDEAFDEGLVVGHGRRPSSTRTGASGTWHDWAVRRRRFHHNTAGMMASSPTAPK